MLLSWWVLRHHMAIKYKTKQKEGKASDKHNIYCISGVTVTLDYGISGVTPTPLMVGLYIFSRGVCGFALCVFVVLFAHSTCEVCNCRFYHVFNYTDINYNMFHTAKKFCCRSILGLDIDSSKILYTLISCCTKAFNELNWFTLFCASVSLHFQAVGKNWRGNIIYMLEVAYKKNWYVWN